MDPIVPFDWPRLFLGEAPPLFLAEILFRVLVILIWTAALLRWIGGRSIAQLSLVEFLLVIALGSAVGDSLFYPEVPLLHAMLAILLVVLADKLADLASRRWARARSVIDGRPIEVICDGTIRVDGMMNRGIDARELMQMLRLHGVENLGAVRRAYLEPSGALSLFRAEPPRPGLPLVPPVELCGPEAPAPGAPVACRGCGHVAPSAAGACPNCALDDWTAARRMPCIAG